MRPRCEENIHSSLLASPVRSSDWLLNSLLSHDSPNSTKHVLLQHFCVSWILSLHKVRCNAVKISEKRPCATEPRQIPFWKRNAAHYQTSVTDLSMTEPTTSPQMRIKTYAMYFQNRCHGFLAFLLNGFLKLVI